MLSKISRKVKKLVTFILTFGLNLVFVLYLYWAQYREYLVGRYDVDTFCCMVFVLAFPSIVIICTGYAMYGWFYESKNHGPLPNVDDYPR